MNLEELKQYCYQDSGREEIQHPYSIGAFTYATDGRILVRIPRLAEITNGNTSTIERNSVSFFTEPPDNRVAIPDTLPQLLGQVTCNHCIGEKICDCWDCNPNNPKHMARCSCCGGTGLMDEPAVVVTIGEQLVSHLYLHKIKNLPNLVLFAGTSVHSPLRFTFDGGEGILMPMRKET